MQSCSSKRRKREELTAPVVELEMSLATRRHHHKKFVSVSCIFRDSLPSLS